jgi:hypothetical protein
MGCRCAVNPSYLATWLQHFRVTGHKGTGFPEGDTVPGKGTQIPRKGTQGDSFRASTRAHFAAHDDRGEGGAAGPRRVACSAHVLDEILRGFGIGYRFLPQQIFSIFMWGFIGRISPHAARASRLPTWRLMRGGGAKLAESRPGGGAKLKLSSWGALCAKPQPL